ncbi:Ca-activated chloride channel family protein [Thermocatellispora tengchongensis]|uniref:Ca-activated chloride channel family protein n=1 Tax=Thermocatellispora tengchongensis TaxID=1073253 RepID=A0A840PM68_9ACTN|nr:VWA domain-containing protein [Thermocatellispora tengchongensis]MBB5139093.1 Ca-activated chloride channel family protein [Thermocatellispora tengchongensis]
MFRLALAVLGVAASILVPAPAAAADETPGQVLILLDTSGSMKEDDGTGTSRIAAARRAIGKVVDAAPDDARIGLRSYGGGCRDTDLRIPIGPLDRAAVKERVAALRPRGDTPIAYALRKAAGDFQDKAGGGVEGEEERTILLVSDGEETCGGDPVAVAEELRRRGVEVRTRIDVIGFRVDERARAQLKQIAKKGGGRYVDAQNGAELAGRLRRATERGLRGFSPVGTPVTGTPDTQGAPLLRPGAYVDELPPDRGAERPGRHYAFDLPPGATAYVGVRKARSAPLGRPAVIGAGLSILPPNAPGHCQTTEATTNLPSGGNAFAVGQVQHTAGSGSPTGNCDAPGRYYIRVDNRTDDPQATPATIELTLIVEPRASNVSALPPPATELGPVDPITPGTPVRIAGSASYGDGPVLEDGRTYTDTLIPGEEAYFRVPLRWGEQLAYRVDLPALSDADRKALGGATLKLSTSILSPENPRVLGGNLTDDAWRPDLGDRPQTFTGATVPVAYRNRESGQDHIREAGIPGYYNVWVRLYTDRDSPYLEVPVTLTVDVRGEAGAGAPVYDDPTGLGTPEQQQGLAPLPAPTPSATPSPVSASPVAAPRPSGGVPPLAIALASAVAALLAAGTALLVVRRRRRAG